MMYVKKLSIQALYKNIIRTGNQIEFHISIWKLGFEIKFIWWDEITKVVPMWSSCPHGIPHCYPCNICDWSETE